jgi:hypothetical protein
VRHDLLPAGRRVGQHHPRAASRLDDGALLHLRVHAAVSQHDLPPHRGRVERARHAELAAVVKTVAVHEGSMAGRGDGDGAT